MYVNCWSVACSKLLPSWLVTNHTNTWDVTSCRRSKFPMTTTW